MNHKFAQLIQTPGKNSHTCVEVYIAQPDSHKEDLAGKLFILIEINQNNENSIKVINFLTDSIVHNFYQNEKLLLRERMPSLKVEHIFEASLAKTNKQFTDFLKNENINIPLQDISISTGIVFNNEIHLSNNGCNNAYLIFTKADSSDNNKEKIALVNIFKSKDDLNETSKYRLFSNVINGQIPPMGSVFISNEALSEYISQKQLCDIIGSLPPAGAVEQMRNIINNINTYISFAGIIIKNTILEKPVEAPRLGVQASNNSIYSLNRTEENTEALLTPSGMISFKKWFKLLSPLSKFFNKFNKSQLKPNGALFLKDKIFMKRKSFLNLSKLMTGKFLLNIYRALINLAKNLKLKTFFINIADNVPKLGAFLSKIRFIVKGLFLNKKFLVSFLLLLLVIFIYNLTNTKDQQLAEENLQKYKTITMAIEQKQNQADSSLIYSNDERAKKLFDEINTLIEELPKETAEQQASYNNFKEKFNIQLDKIRRITKTDSAEVLTDLISVNGNANTLNIEYSKKKNKLYVADSSQKSIYIFNIDEKKTSTITDLDNPIEKLAYPLINDDGNESIYYLNSNNIISLSTQDEDFSAIPIESLDSNFLGGSGFYGGNIYLADTKNSQIYRYSKNGNKLGSPTAWLKDKIDLSQTIDLAIDGSIYILQKDGTIIKLLRGSKVDFSLEACDPPLDAANSLSVSKDKDFIYISEAKNKRLVVYTKTGQFLMQYQGDNLNNLKDFVVDQDNKTIYFLNDTKILKLGAVHFE